MDKKRGNTVQTRNLSTDTGDRESVYPFKQGESVMGVDHGRNQRSTPQQSPIEERVTSVIRNVNTELFKITEKALFNIKNIATYFKW